MFGCILTSFIFSYMLRAASFWSPNQCKTSTYTPLTVLKPGEIPLGWTLVSNTSGTVNVFHGVDSYALVIAIVCMHELTVHHLRLFTYLAI